MKNILIPINFKSNSHDAINYAVNFFQQEKCNFFLLNTFSYESVGMNAIHLLHSDDDWFTTPKCDSEISLGRVIQKYTINSENDKHRFNAISECSDLIEGIKKAIKEINIDMVIIPGQKQIGRASDKYSRNTKRILENIRECPVMIIPSSAQLQLNPEFVLVSSFEDKLPFLELENWYELVQIVKGNVKIIALSAKDNMTDNQKSNRNHLLSLLEILSKNSVSIEYLETSQDLRNFANYHSDYIICLIDRKPDFWRKFGLTNSQVTNLGPLKRTPLIALHH
ncbi:universal stress protein [Ulvibacter antarcticus]|uniref:Nucleotide-binding universal stress UspA family protein n=1 Tax=Ulvibacter antarcticus TaxID=442714 RepID=A0A3L9YGZ9_9FLAO|nr:universal stress protein [Ulvibacter antarcticus]RMA58730.1 hypothetical protein BXY75_2107 [Ulvibacter antarcticus]